MVLNDAQWRVLNKVFQTGGDTGRDASFLAQTQDAERGDLIELQRGWYVKANMAALGNRAVVLEEEELLGGVAIRLKARGLASATREENRILLFLADADGMTRTVRQIQAECAMGLWPITLAGMRGLIKLKYRGETLDIASPNLLMHLPASDVRAYMARGRNRLPR